MTSFPSGSPRTAIVKVCDNSFEERQNEDKKIGTPDAQNRLTLIFIWKIETLLDLSKYAEEPADGAVVAWTITHTEPNMSGPSRDMKFTIKAEALAKKDIIKEEVAEIKSADETAEEKPMEEIKSKDEL